MPKMNDRERLAKIEADQQSLAREAEAVRRNVRSHYGALIGDLAVEKLTERDFRDLIGQAIRVGGSAAIAALKALSPAPPASPKSPERRPGDEHGGAARRRPALDPSAASPGDGAGR